MPVVHPVDLLPNLPEQTALGASLAAVMLFPEAEAEKERAIVSTYLGLQVTALSSTASNISVPTDSLLLALKYAELTGQVQMRWERGLRAGEVLFLLLSLAKDSPREASVKKALSLAEKLYKSSRHKHNTQHRLGTRTLNTAWSEMKDVAHFWAAYQQAFHALKETSGFTTTSFILSWIRNPFLIAAPAEGYLKFGLSHIYPNQKDQKTTLDPQKVWKLGPGSIPAPPRCADPNQLYVSLEPSVATLLSGYKYTGAK